MNHQSLRRSINEFLQRAGLSIVAIAASLLLLSGSVFADGAAMLAHRDAACYCHCGMSHARGGCVKMCETPKYASRWWATSCARHKSKVSHDASKAGPRFPRPGRAERAAVTAPQTGESR